MVIYSYWKIQISLLIFLIEFIYYHIVYILTMLILQQTAKQQYDSNCPLAHVPLHI